MGPGAAEPRATAPACQGPCRRGKLRQFRSRREFCTLICERCFRLSRSSVSCQFFATVSSLIRTQAGEDAPSAIAAIEVPSNCRHGIPRTAAVFMRRASRADAERRLRFSVDARRGQRFGCSLLAARSSSRSRLRALLRVVTASCACLEGGAAPLRAARSARSGSRVKPRRLELFASRVLFRRPLGPSPTRERFLRFRDRFGCRRPASLRRFRGEPRAGGYGGLATVAPRADRQSATGRPASNSNPLGCSVRDSRPGGSV